MDTVRLSLQGAWNLFWVGLLLGAGLPIIFALGVRLLSGPADSVASDGTLVTHEPSVLQRGLAWVCFATVVLAVGVGLMVIVGAGTGKEVSFEHIFPTLVPKS
jgi:hypothetical protein